MNCRDYSSLKKIIRTFWIALAIPLSLHGFSQPAFAVTNRSAVVNRALDAWEGKPVRSQPRAREPIETSPVFAKNPGPENWPESTYPADYFTDYNTDRSTKKARENVAPDKTKTHAIHIASELFWAKYEEPNVMEQRGTMWGFGGSYTYRPDRGHLFYNPIVNTFRLEGMFANGKFDYEAESLAQTGLQTKDNDDFMFDLRTTFGKEFIEEKVTLLPYTGLGHRYLSDDDDGSLSFVNGVGYYGYERKSRYYYIPAGITISAPLSPDWRISVNGEYDFFLYGRQTSYFSDADIYTALPNDDVANDQDNGGYGIRFSIQLARESKHLTFFAEPFFRYWNIEDSSVTTAFVGDAVGDWIEPANNTIEQGIKLGLLF